MQENPNQSPIIEIKLEDMIMEEVKAEGKNMEETRYPIEITPEHDKSEINIKPEFQVHVVVSQDENITDTGPEIYSPIELTPFKIETEGNQQIEVKTEYGWLKTNTNTKVNTDYEKSIKAEIKEVIAEYNQAETDQTEVNTDYEQSTKAEIEEVNAQYNQAETDQNRPDRMSLKQTALNQHQEEVSQ